MYVLNAQITDERNIVHLYAHIYVAYSSNYRYQRAQQSVMKRYRFHLLHRAWTPWPSR